MPCHYTLASIARELRCGGHPGRAKVLTDADERLCTLEREYTNMGKLHHIIAKQKARIEQLEKQVASSVPVDQQDRTTIDGYDENGDPVAAGPITAEELTAELKTSADALNGAIAEAQPVAEA